MLHRMGGRALAFRLFENVHFPIPPRHLQIHPESIFPDPHPPRRDPYNPRYVVRQTTLRNFKIFKKKTYISLYFVTFANQYHDPFRPRRDSC